MAVKKKLPAGNRKTKVVASRKGAKKLPSKRKPVKLAASVPDDVRLQELIQTNRQLKRKIFDLYTVFDINRTINAVLDYQELLDSFIFTCLGQIAGEKGAIFLSRHGQDGRFYLAKAKGAGKLPSSESAFPSDSKLAQHLIRLNRPLPINDFSDEQLTPEEREIIACFPNGVLVPLTYKSKLSGLFVLGSKLSGAPFTSDHLEFLSILGNQIAVAIENALLFESVVSANDLLRQTQQQLVQSERLAALGEMSARVAHEVNNPLGIIKNYVLLICREHREAQVTQSYAKIITDEIDRIARIVQELLVMHRPEVSSLRLINVTQILDDVLVMMERPLTANNIQVERSFGATPILARGIADGLKQVFLNVIINARDAMLENGTRGVLRVAATAESGQVRITISDNGPGIPADVIPKIFEPFFTTKEGSKGTGLGLSVCYAIMKKHNGSITFSNLNPGGCFEITLPAESQDVNDEH